VHDTSHGKAARRVQRPRTGSWFQRGGAALLVALGVGACLQQASAPGAADVKPISAGQTAGESQLGDLLEGKSASALAVSGKAERVRVSEVDVTGQSFQKAMRAEILEGSAQEWDVQVSTKTKTPVAAGDVLLATFHVRATSSREESGEARTEFVFELAREPWSKSAQYPVRAGREWRQIHVPFVAAESYAAGEAQIIFRLGYTQQTLEIGGVTVENFGKQKQLAELPRTKLTYPGMEADAPWRKAAEERIEKHRKANFAIEVRDAARRVVKDAEVRVKLVRHGFGFGTCAPAGALTSAGNEEFKRRLTELFNIVTLENDLKWQPLAGDWGPDYTLARAQAGVDWLRERGLSARGHVLVWPGFRNLPKHLKAEAGSAERLRAMVKDHVKELTTALRGKLVHWDVVNEPFDNHDLLDILGADVMAEWFQTARVADPAAKLFINDYQILSGGGGTTAHRDHYERTIKRLLEQKAPLDAIGMQGHFGSALTGPEDVLSIVDRYAKLGKPIWVTEYDVVIDDEELAGRFTNDLYTVLFSHPQVDGIVMWGFWDGAHWKQNAPLFRRDWSEKPAGKAYRELVLGRFRTDVKGKTDAAGKYATRAFLGDYEVSVIRAGKTKTVKAQLPAAGSSLAVVLD
jgi:GH35 family endo-1,4-beta-xylanase